MFTNVKSPLHDYLKNTVFYMSSPGVNVTVPDEPACSKSCYKLFAAATKTPRIHLRQDSTIINIEVQCCYSFMLSLAQEMAQLLQDGARQFD